MPADGATDDVAGVDNIFSIKSIRNNTSLYRQPGLNTAMFNVHGKESRVRMHGEELHQLCCLFPLFASSVRIVRCRLRHSSSLERDSSLTGTFPTERSGSGQERRVQVKRSRSSQSRSIPASGSATVGTDRHIVVP